MAILRTQSPSATEMTAGVYEEHGLVSTEDRDIQMLKVSMNGQVATGDHIEAVYQVGFSATADFNIAGGDWVVSDSTDAPIIDQDQLQVRADNTGSLTGDQLDEPKQDNLRMTSFPGRVPWPEREELLFRYDPGGSTQPLKFSVLIWYVEE